MLERLDLIKEEREMERRVDKLAEFLLCDRRLGGDERILLTDQLGFMKEYLRILRKRIRRFRK